MVDLSETPPEEVVPPPDAPAVDTGWRTDAQGREYVPRPKGSGSGNVYRQGEETVEDALARSASKEQRPRRKPKTPKMPAASRKVDLKDLEATLAEAFKAPAMPCAAFGDQWAAEHFTRSGPYLARNLVLASEHNPWIRRKLEEFATGGDAMMKVLALMPVMGAVVGYALPPLIYWANLPVPEKTREMFGIPPRKQPPPAYAATETPTPPYTPGFEPAAAEAA